MITLRGALSLIVTFLMGLSAAAESGLFFREDVAGKFSIGNDLTSYHLQLNEGTVSLLREEKADGTKFLEFEESYFFKDPKAESNISSFVEAQTVAGDRVTNPHLSVVVTAQGEGFAKRLVFRLYPASTMLACDVYYRGSGFSVDPGKIDLFAMKTEERHWKYKAVEFFDRTDENNNLVSEREIVAYQEPMFLNGNLLFARNLMTDSSFVILKEAPSSFSQINHPGYDFELSKYGLAVRGVGFESGDVDDAGWTKGYSIVIGGCGPDELEQLKMVRSYQKAIRAYDPTWDEMIMMNTWGDRNRDANIGEGFVKREVDACQRLGITHLQIDDGWQQGLSKNSAVEGSAKWDQWDLKDWEPHRERFPNGFQAVVDYAESQGVTLGLWFAPSNANSFGDWERDAKVIIGLHKKYGVRYFKIDGIRLPSKLAEENLRKMYSLILKETDQGVFFNVDATAHARGGYHFLYEYGGNIFLENRYTTWSKYYYPYQTLRNLWMLSKYVPAERFQIEFLNKWKNTENYSKEDLFSPINVPFDYMFATTMLAQPLAWFEGSALPEEAFAIGDLIREYSAVQAKVHQGAIFPIGKEPDGRAWTGFQSLASEEEGYLMFYREQNQLGAELVSTHLDPETSYHFSKVLGEGSIESKATDESSRVRVSIPNPQGFALFQYRKTE